MIDPEDESRAGFYGLIARLFYAAPDEGVLAQMLHADAFEGSQAPVANAWRELVDACRNAPGVSSVVNGRFKGGYITRHHGQPANHIHAVQLEKCQSLYMQEVVPFIITLKKLS